MKRTVVLLLIALNCEGCQSPDDQQGRDGDKGQYTVKNNSSIDLDLMQELAEGDKRTEFSWRIEAPFGHAYLRPLNNIIIIDAGVMSRDEFQKVHFNKDFFPRNNLPIIYRHEDILGQRVLFVATNGRGRAKIQLFPDRPNWTPVPEGVIPEFYSRLGTKVFDFVWDNYYEKKARNYKKDLNKDLEFDLIYESQDKPRGFVSFRKLEKMQRSR